MYILNYFLTNGSDRLCSQLNNYFAMYAICRKTNHTLALNVDKLLLSNLLTNCFNVPFPYIKMDHTFEQYHITKHPFDENLFKLDPNKNYNFNGLIHCGIKYYEDYILDIQNVFTFKPEHLSKAINFIQKIKTDSKKIVSIHLRRTDYIHPETLGMSMEYYKKAISHFNTTDYKIVICSDDIGWCKSNGELNYIIKKFDYVFCEENDYTTLCIMTLCDASIVANSCFSIMGSVLNKTSHITICPYSYVIGSHVINGNYFKKDWIALDTI